MKDVANLASFTCLDHLGYNIAPVTPQVASPLRAFCSSLRAPRPPLLRAISAVTWVLQKNKTQPFPTARLQRFTAGRVSADPPGIAGGFPKEHLLPSDIPPPPPSRIHLGKRFIFHFQSCLLVVYFFNGLVSVEKVTFPIWQSDA